MESRERIKVEKYGGDYCDFEDSSKVTDAFELLNPNDYPEEQRNIVEEFNRRVEIGNQRYHIAMYRAEMFEKGFNAGMYICTFDHAENMISFVFTDETRRLLGYEGIDDLPNEFDSWVKTLLPDQREAMVPIFWSTVKAHRQLPDISHAEYPMVRKDGKIIWVTGAGRFIRREDGSLEIYMGCYRDVTAEHEKDDYLHIIEGIGKVFNFSLYIDMSNGTYKIVTTNEYVEKVRKAPNAFQFLRDNVDTSVHPDYREELKAWLQQENISALLKENDTTSKDFYSADADMWFRGIFMVGDKNEDGSLNHIIYGCQDITNEKNRELKQKEDLKKAKEAAEKRSNELNKQLDVIGSLSNAYFICIGGDVDKNDFTVYKENDFLHELLKSGECETVDAAFAKYIPLGIMPEDQEKMAVFTDRLTLPTRMGKNDVISIEIHGTVPELEWCRASWIAVKRDESGRAHSFLFVMENITEDVRERKRQENELKLARDQAEAANRAKSTFLFNMSHDIRTPMNAIIGFTDLIEKHYEDREKCMGYIHRTQEANKFLLSLINNVLEMARIESGKEQLDETVCQTGVVTHEMFSIFETQIRKKNITFTSKVDIHSPYMLCDQPKLREICLNILSNAVKYTPEGGSIHVQMLELPSERPGYARLRGVCADSGIGMSKEYLPHLFEEFTRAKSATESRQQGTGLGMPIVKKLIDLMGGTIEVESELGKGTTFTVTIELKIVDKLPEAKQENEAKIAQMNFEGKRILLAEDNDLNAEIAMDILSEHGFKVERAEDGIVCVDMLTKAEAGYYNLILMDIQMPNLDGYGATRIIRKMDDTAKANIPIIAMTANAFDEDKRNALNAGMNAHVAKPISIPVLITELTKILP